MSIIRVATLVAIIIPSLLSTILYIQLRQCQSRAGALEADISTLRVDVTTARAEAEYYRHERTRVLSELTERNRVVTTVEVRPDGTRIETVDRTEESTKVFDEVSDKKEEGWEVSDETTQVVERTVERDLRSRYSIGVYYPAALAWEPADVGVSVGARLGNLPVFVEVGGVPGRRTITVGARYEW